MLCISERPLRIPVFSCHFRIFFVAPISRRLARRRKTDIRYECNSGRTCQYETCGAAVLSSDILLVLTAGLIGYGHLDLSGLEHRSQIRRSKMCSVFQTAGRHNLFTGPGLLTKSQYCLSDCRTILDGVLYGILYGILGGDALIPVKHHHEPGFQNLELKAALSLITGVGNLFEARAEVFRILGVVEDRGNQ